jgi:hypothetical protein
MAEKRKSFAGYTAGEARTYASDWLRNFKDHGPLDIKSIRVSEDRDHYVATVIYSEMTLEPPPPQHFADYQPVLLKSA